MIGYPVSLDKCPSLMYKGQLSFCLPLSLHDFGKVMLATLERSDVRGKVIEAYGDESYTMYDLIAAMYKDQNKENVKNMISDNFWLVLVDAITKLPLVNENFKFDVVTVSYETRLEVLES